jgi:hypothetical protein
MTYRLNILIFIGLTIYYYYNDIGGVESYQVFLTISTFLFSIFAGFFIANQGKRYAIIRQQIANMDGEMSSMYRQFGHLGKKTQDEVKKIIKKDYDKIVKSHEWDYHFAEKTTIITRIHQLAEKATKGKKITQLQAIALERILVSLANLQQIRKTVIVLRQERIPRFEWILLAFLAGILLITVSLIPSYGLLLGSALKGVFAGSIIFVFILLSKLNRLELFEKIVGEESAKDVLDIFAGRR